MAFVADDARAAAIRAHGSALDGEIALLDAFGLPIAANRWQHAVMSLAARAIQLQRAVHDAAASGYADDELTPVARAMLSSLVTLAYIGRGRSSREREARALAWTLRQMKSQERLYEYLWRSRRMRKRDIDVIAHDNRAGYAAMVAAAAAAGVTPAPKVGKRDTWTGLSDVELFRRTGYLKFYREYYAPWSDESHAGPTTLNPFLEQGRKGSFEIGPRHLNPWFILFGTARIGILVLGHLNTMFRLRQDAAIRQVFDTMQNDFSRVLEQTRGKPEMAESD